MPTTACRWWLRLPEREDFPGGIGVCKRYPPTLVTPVSNNARALAVHPRTTPSDYCGEFTPLHDPPCRTGGGLTADDIHDLKGNP